METKRELTCIGCPMGCQITVVLENGKIKGLTGYTCENGEHYARREVTNPTRIVTSTVVLKGGKYPRLSVKTASDIPKDKIFDVMDAINQVVAEAPVKIGDVVLRDAAGTGVDIIATKNAERAAS